MPEEELKGYALRKYSIAPMLETAQAKKKGNRQKAQERRQGLGLATRVLRLRLKDKHIGFLSGLALEVNCVWNFDNETS